MSLYLPRFASLISSSLSELINGIGIAFSGKFFPIFPSITEAAPICCPYALVLGRCSLWCPACAGLPLLLEPGNCTGRGVISSAHISGLAMVPGSSSLNKRLMNS